MERVYVSSIFVGAPICKCLESPPLKHLGKPGDNDRLRHRVLTAFSGALTATQHLPYVSSSGCEPCFGSCHYCLIFFSIRESLELVEERPRHYVVGRILLSMIISRLSTCTGYTKRETPVMSVRLIIRTKWHSRIRHIWGLNITTSPDDPLGWPDSMAFRS